MNFIIPPDLLILGGKIKLYFRVILNLLFYIIFPLTKHTIKNK